MLRTAIALGCAGLLALSLSLTSYAGLPDESADTDGVPDAIDNCDEIPNGPLAGSCSAQQDGDGDGFGNPCDTDTNNDLQTDLGDVSATLAESKIGGTSPVYDFDCDGSVSLGDVSHALGDSKIGKVPGPACDHPLGTPCP